MNNPEVLWVILLVGYFIFSAILRGLRQKKQGDSQTEEEDREPDRPWWEENWPSEPPEESQHEQKQPSEPEASSEPETIKRKDDKMAGERSFKHERSSQEENVDQDVAAKEEEYKKPSHESATQQKQQSDNVDNERASYERPENKPFERHQSKPYERKKNSWEEAEKHIYNWQEPSQKKARKKKKLRIDARRAFVHDAILNRPYK